MRGIDKFREYFVDYSDQYVLIGGSACELPEKVLKDMKQFMVRYRVSSATLKSMGMKEYSAENVLNVIRSTYLSIEETRRKTDGGS